MFGSSPASGSKSMHLMYLLAITAAQRTIHLSSAYFVSDKLSSQAHLTALERGVKVQIIVQASTAMRPSSRTPREPGGTSCWRRMRRFLYAADFARRQVAVFNADLSRSRRISLNEWQQRSLSKKFLEHAASLIGSQL